jgi:hypothetical protein
MRDWWYGDKRDVVKWGTALVLARKWSITTVLQVALYRADRPTYQLAIDGATESTETLPVEVIRHFRNIEHIQRLADDVQLRIDIHKDPFQWCPEYRTLEDFRRSYFTEVADKIKQYSEPMIVFLDPDTGIAPANYKYEHVTPKEIQTVLRAMKSGDLLLCYQHARLGDGEWLNTTREEYRQAIGADVPMQTITCNEIANDVAFFVVERSKWVGAAPRQ